MTTVSELIAKLSEFSGDLKVVIGHADDFCPLFDPIEKVEQLTGNGDDVAWHPVDWGAIGYENHHAYHPDEVDERVVIWSNEVL